MLIKETQIKENNDESNSYDEDWLSALQRGSSSKWIGWMIEEDEGEIVLFLVEVGGFLHRRVP